MVKWAVYIYRVIRRVISHTGICLQFRVAYVMASRCLPTIIIDNGTGVLKAGLSGEEQHPTVVMHRSAIKCDVERHALAQVNLMDRPRSHLDFELLTEVSRKNIHALQNQ